MLKTCIPLLVVPTEAGIQSNMAETKVMRVEEPSPPCPHAERNGVPSTIRVAKVCGDQHHDSLHRVLQKATSPAHKGQNWPQHQLPSRRSAQNLFLEGFRDCASEVIRFLTEEEKVEDNNPLLMGLQSHLVHVSRAICQETIMDLDKDDAYIEKQEHDKSMPAADRFHSHGVLLSPCTVSPVISQSVNSSVSDSSAVQLDISMSVSSTTDIGHHSFSLDNNSSMQNNVDEMPCESCGECCQADDVFHSSVSHAETQQFASRPNSHPAVCSVFGSVLPLSHLARAALLKTGKYQQDVMLGVRSPLQATSSDELPGFMLTTTASHFDPRTSPDLPVQYCPPLGHSSPIPVQTVSSFQSDSPYLTPLGGVLSSSEAYTTPLLQSPHSSTSCSDNSVQAGPNHQQQFIQHQAREQTADGVIPQRHCLSDVATIRLCPSDVATLRHCPSDVATIRNCPFDVATISELQGQSHSSELLPQLSSILELKANFLPGIETSSVASGSFADILLAVESCQYHEDPRVRALAGELIHLIHDDDYEEEDIDDDDSENENVGVRNVNNIQRDNDEESGIEMMDESVEWGSAVDMIEQ